MENDYKKITSVKGPLQPFAPCFICGQAAFSRFCRKNSFALWRCQNCALLFVYPLPEPARLYSADYFSGASNGFGYANYDQDKSAMVPAFKKYLACLNKLAPKQGKLLDVGAATGFFIKLAQADGWQAEGVEISDYAADLGRRQGLNLKTGTLTTLSLPESFYSAVTMLDVLEHLTDPLSTLKKAFKILNPGGLLLINTPDASSFIARLLGKNWHLLVPPEHLHYFGRKNLEKFLSNNGFKIVLTGRVGKSFSLEYIFKTLYCWQKLPVWLWLARLCRQGWLNKISLPVHLRDNLLMIAQKNENAENQH